MSRDTWKAAAVPVVVGIVVWAVVYLAGALLYGLILAVFVDLLLELTPTTRDLVYGVLVGLVVVGATFVMTVVVRRRRAEVAWWLLTLPLLTAAWGLLNPPVGEPVWPAVVTFVIGVGGSAAVVWLLVRRRGAARAA